MVQQRLAVALSLLLLRRSVWIRARTIRCSKLSTAAPFKSCRNISLRCGFNWQLEPLKLSSPSSNVDLGLFRVLDFGVASPVRCSAYRRHQRRSSCRLRGLAKIDNAHWTGPPRLPAPVFWRQPLFDIIRRRFLLRLFLRSVDLATTHSALLQRRRCLLAAWPPRGSHLAESVRDAVRAAREMRVLLPPGGSASSSVQQGGENSSFTDPVDMDCLHTDEDCKLFWYLSWTHVQCCTV